MKPILKCLHEMPDFQFCHWTWLSMSLDSLSIPFVPFVRKYTERATCFQQSVRASMLKCYWIGLGGAGDSAYDSTAGLQVSHWWQRAAPHVELWFSTPVLCHWGHFLQHLLQPVDSSYTIYLPLMLVGWPSSWMLPWGTCSDQPCASRVTKEVLVAQMIKKKNKFYLQCKGVWKSLSHIWFFATSWTMAHQAPQSMGISQARILEWIAIPFSRDLLAPGIKPRSPALQADSYCLSHQGSPQYRRLGFNSLVWEDPLEKGMAAHSSILAWRIPGTEEPGRL